MRQTVSRNQTSFEPYGEFIEEALEYIQDNPQYSLYRERFDAFAEQENCEIREKLLNPTSDNHSHMNDDEILLDDSLRSLVRSSSILIGFYPQLFCNQKIPQEGGREAWRAEWSFFEKWCRFLKLEFIKVERCQG